MKYIVYYTTNDYENGTVDVFDEEIEGFEEMMELFTLLSSSKDNVLVIEPEHKKVVCHYRSEGKVMFNRCLTDGATYFNNGMSEE